MAAGDGPLCEPKLSSSGLGNATPWICLRSLPTPLNPHVQWRAGLPFCVTPSVLIVLRQYGNVDPFSIGYAFRPGLRTVIVTAAVYRGFSSELRPEGLTPLFNLPAPGRRQTLYVVLLTLQSPVFLVNSRLGRFTATPPSSRSKFFHQRGHPLSRSYGVNLPSY